MSNAIPLRDRIIPWYFVIFFAFIALVDGVMVTLAVTTHTGLVTEHPYEKGLAYNSVVKAEETQEALGWSGSMTFTASTLTFMPYDAKRMPIPLDHVTARFTRPTQAGMDFDVPLTQSATGTWQAKVEPPAKGLWEVRIFAEHDAHNFQQAKRIVVP